MSEELQKQVKDLTEANQNLNNQIAQSSAGVEGLLSQLDAHREALNESLTTGLNMRATIMHLKKVNFKLTNQFNEISKKLEDANKKIIELGQVPA